MRSLALDQVHCDTFAPFVGERVEAAVEAGGPAVANLELSQATTLGSAPESGRQAFSVVFDGPPDLALPQGMYWLRHPGLGELGLFLVPIAGNDQYRRYEAVFN